MQIIMLKPESIQSQEWVPFVTQQVGNCYKKKYSNVFIHIETIYSKDFEI